MKVCPKCNTSFARAFDVCAFCGHHAHLRLGRICQSCGRYTATRAEERELARMEADTDFEEFMNENAEYEAAF